MTGPTLADSNPQRQVRRRRGPGRQALDRPPLASSPDAAPLGPIREEVVLDYTRRLYRSLAGLTRRAGVLLAHGVAVPAALGQPAAAAAQLEQAPTTVCPQPPGDRQRQARPAGHPHRGHGRAADLRAGGDRVPDTGRAAPHGRQRRMNDPLTRIAPCLLPHTIQLCVHCHIARPGSGSAARAARWCDDRGAWLAARNSTKTAMT